MPNWVLNKLTLLGSKKENEEIFKFIGSDELSINIKKYVLKNIAQTRTAILLGKYMWIYGVQMIIQN